MSENYVTVNNHASEGEMFKNTERLLRYRIEYPQFMSKQHGKGLGKINRYYRKRALVMQENFESELCCQALRQYEDARRNNFPFHAYEAYVAGNVTYNQDCVISVYADVYQFTGGAHGNTLRESETWNICTGERICLSHIIGNPQDALRMICKQIATQISQGENWYFDNHIQLAAKNFNPENFYLSKAGPVIYYQQYDIAPYSSGLPQFILPWGENIKRPKCCR